MAKKKMATKKKTEESKKVLKGGTPPILLGRGKLPLCKKTTPAYESWSVWLCDETGGWEHREEYDTKEGAEEAMREHVVDVDSCYVAGAVVDDCIPPIEYKIAECGDC